MKIDGFHPILYVDDPVAERDFYALFGFETIYEGPEFPDFLAISAGSATLGLSPRRKGSQLPIENVRWQFTVDSVDGVVEVCEAGQLSFEVIVEEGGAAFRSRIVKVSSPNGVTVWFEGPNEAD